MLQGSLVLQVRFQPYILRVDNLSEIASLFMLLLNYFVSLVLQLSTTLALPNPFLLSLVVSCDCLSPNSNVRSIRSRTCW